MEIQRYYTIHVPGFLKVRILGTSTLNALIQANNLYPDIIKYADYITITT